MGIMEFKENTDMATATEYRRLVARGENTFIAGTRVSIQQLYHWRKCGMEWTRIREIATSMTDTDEEEARMFIAEHEAELADQAAVIDARIEREKAECRSKFPEMQALDDLSPESRRDRLWAKLQQRRTEANGAHHPGG
jgi:hypothetical protein